MKKSQQFSQPPLPRKPKHATLLNSKSGEGRCPVVPLVFKTSDRVFREFNEDRGLVTNPLFFLPFSFFLAVTYFSYFAQKLSFYPRIGKRIGKRISLAVAKILPEAQHGGIKN